MENRLVRIHNNNPRLFDQLQTLALRWFPFKSSIPKSEVSLKEGWTKGWVSESPVSPYVPGTFVELELFVRVESGVRLRFPKGTFCVFSGP